MILKCFDEDRKESTWYKNIINYNSDKYNTIGSWQDHIENLLGNKAEFHYMNMPYPNEYIKFYNDEDGLAFLLKYS